MKKKSIETGNEINKIRLLKSIEDKKIMKICIHVILIITYEY